MLCVSVGVGVGAGGLGTFWGELFWGKYYMFEKSFFSPFLGVVSFGRAFNQPWTGQIPGPIKTNTPRVVLYLKRVPKWT